MDARASEFSPPARLSDDKRPISTHGKRLLCALENSGIILNGLTSHGFTRSCTRYPQRIADCAGVIDYVCSSPSLLHRLSPGSLQLPSSMADFSDHLPLTLTVRLDHIPVRSEVGALHFRHERLPVLRLPEDPEVWVRIDSDITDEPNASGLS